MKVFVHPHFGNEQSGYVHLFLVSNFFGLFPDGSESSKQSPNKTEVFFVAQGEMTDAQVPPAGVMRPIVITASADSVTSSAVSERTDIFSDEEEEEEDFCIIDDAGLGITVSCCDTCMYIGCIREEDHCKF